MSIRTLPGAIVAVLFLVGGAESVSAQTPPSSAVLQNIAYPSEFTAGRSAPLRDGTYEEPAAPGSASMITVTFVQSASGADFAAVILATSSGGTGTFYTLHVVTQSAGAPIAGPGLALGDRIRVDAMSVSGSTVRIDMTVQGPNDPACCPSQTVTREFMRSGGAFTAVQAGTPTGIPAPPKTGNAGLATRDARIIVVLLTMLAAVTVYGTRVMVTRRNRQ